jgi:hypothetical protein
MDHRKKGLTYASTTQIGYEGSTNELSGGLTAFRRDR